jgi:hypothetical protein
MVGPRRPLRGGPSRIMLGLQVSNPSPISIPTPILYPQETVFLQVGQYAIAEFQGVKTEKKEIS